MSKTLGVILTLTLVVVGWIGVSVQAQTTLADTRERVNGVLVQLQTFDNVCVVILAGLINEIDVDVLDARKLITVGKGNLTNLLFDAIRSSVNGVNRFVDTLTQCETLIGDAIDDENAGTIFGEVNTVLAEVTDHNTNDGLDDRKFFKIRGLINNIVLANLTQINGIIGLGGNSSGVSNLSAGATAVNGKLDDILMTYPTTGAGTRTVPASGLIANPALTEKGPFTFDDLREIKIALGEAHEIIVQIKRLIKRITVYKKWVLKGLREVYNLLRASNFGGRASESFGIAQVYTLSGQRVLSTTNGNLNVNGLANGVYVVAYSDGRVEKLVVAR
jgi:hypothetical protein